MKDDLIYFGENIEEYYKRIEWSMGNGQCPECCGVPENWLGHPSYLTPKTLGHKNDCRLAQAMRSHGMNPLFIGESKLTNEYEHYVNARGLIGRRLKTKDGCPILKEQNKSLFDEALEKTFSDLKLS